MLALDSYNTFVPQTTPLLIALSMIIMVSMCLIRPFSDRLCVQFIDCNDEKPDEWYQSGYDMILKNKKYKSKKKRQRCMRPNPKDVRKTRKSKPVVPNQPAQPTPNEKKILPK